MKLQFDPNQAYQHDAIAAVTDLFEGQPLGQSEYSVIDMGQYADFGLFAGQSRTELGVGNNLLLSEETLAKNTRSIQERNDIDIVTPEKPLDGWDLFDALSNSGRLCPHFSVEMETGTGKTYVYLRTIFELSRRYGFQKFIIVVPSVAIREGVLKNIKITAEHFRALYNNLPFEHFVYDAKKVSRLRQFAISNTLQILVINIDAFRKNFTGTEDEQRSNVIYKESDKLSGRQPIEFVKAARPIVMIDEPQSVDSTDKSQEAIKALNPLCTLRYSATHRNPYNLVYRLDPVRAFELRLVKQIVVASASIKQMPKVEAAKIRITAGQVGVVRGGVTSTAISVAEEHLEYNHRPLPDILAYLQNETELTRSTLVRILKESGRLEEFFIDPQKFMDAIAGILKHELHRLLVDGIKYERIIGTSAESEWEMMLFKAEEVVNYLTALQVNHSVYEYVVYDSEIEKEFAKKLDQRDDIRLFVKRPGWFKIDTPVGEYNPDWAIIKHDDETLYLVRETKSTRDFLKLRTSEADKVRCGQKHFESLGVPFSVVTGAEEV